MNQPTLALQGVRVQNALHLCYICSSNLQRKPKKEIFFMGFASYHEDNLDARGESVRSRHRRLTLSKEKTKKTQRKNLWNHSSRLREGLIPHVHNGTSNHGPRNHRNSYDRKHHTTHVRISVGENFRKHSRLEFRKHSMLRSSLRENLRKHSA